MKATSSASPTTQAFEQAAAVRPAGKYVLRLYVAGATDRSRQAILRARQLCEAELTAGYDLEVIDIYQQPAATKSAQIVAVPTLIKELPFPPQRFVGDMSNTERIVVGLHLQH